MGQQVEWDSIGDGATLMTGLVTFTVEDIAETVTAAKEGRPGGNKMYVASFKATEPPEYKGLTMRDWFAIGNDGDPKAQKPETWSRSIGASRLKRLFGVTHITMSKDVDENIAACIGQSFVAHVTEEVDNGKRGVQFAGRRTSRISRMYPVGMAPLIAGSSEPTLVAPPVASKPLPVRPPASLTAPCPYCSEVILRSEALTHIAAKHPNEV
jgi:hypothetical protein